MSLSALAFIPSDRPSFDAFSGAAPAGHKQKSLFADHLESAAQQKHSDKQSTPASTRKGKKDVPRNQQSSTQKNSRSSAGRQREAPAADPYSPAEEHLQPIPPEHLSSHKADSSTDTRSEKTAITRMLEQLSRGEEPSGSRAVSQMAEPTELQTESSTGEMTGRPLHGRDPLSQAFTSGLQQGGAATGMGETLIDSHPELHDASGQHSIAVQALGGDEEHENNGTAVPGSLTATPRLDADTRYIQSRLPKEALSKIAGQFSEQQDIHARQSQKNPEPDNLSTQSNKGPDEQFVWQKTDLQQAVHHHQPVLVQPLSTGRPATISPPGQPAFYHLPSGLMVPESTVVDQITAHLTINNRLESHEVVLRLNPQELGKVRMTITVEQDNVKAHILTQNPQTREMIDRHLPRLRDALEEQGLHLQQVEVTVATQEQTGDERFQGRDARQQAAAFPGLSIAQQPFSSSISDEEMAVSAASNILNVLI